jgi:hypothetical protein
MLLRNEVGRIPPAHTTTAFVLDDCSLAGLLLLRINETIHHLGLILAWNIKLARRAAAADGQQDGASAANALSRLDLEIAAGRHVLTRLNLST